MPSEHANVVPVDPAMAEIVLSVWHKSQDHKKMMLLKHARTPGVAFTRFREQGIDIGVVNPKPLSLKEKIAHP